MSYDITQISHMLATKAEGVCGWLLPNGKKHGAEWECGSVAGEEGRSLRVHLTGSKAGVWSDFAGEHGGDLVDLIAAVKNMSIAEAVHEAKDYLGIEDKRPDFLPKRTAYKRPQKVQKLTKPGKEMLAWFANRGLTAETVAAFKIGEVPGRDGQPVAVFPYLVDGEVVFIKYRPIHDKKGMWTAKDAEPVLFGWQIVEGRTRDLVITEGELDAMSLYQAGYAALSVPRGGGDGEKQDAWIASEFERLQNFDRIFLALDMDEQGQKAAAHIATRLGAHRCFACDLGKYKDANEALMDGADMGALFDNAHTLDPQELRTATSYIDDVYAFYADSDRRQGERLPWSKTYQTLGLRAGETTIWAGINGHGKSQVLGHVMVASIAAGARWCIASMEFKPHKLLARMFRQACATNQPDESYRDALTRFCDDRLWVFDVQGTAKAERILEVFDYAYRRYGVDHFCIDSLAKCGFGEDAYNDQKAFVDKLSDFARNNDCHVHLVCHSRKRQEEDKMPDKFDIKGTGAITDMVDNVFIIWRNKAKEQKLQEADSDTGKKFLNKTEPDALLNCVKQREGEWEGLVRLWFDQRSLQFMESVDALPVPYVTQGDTASTAYSIPEHQPVYGDAEAW